MNVYFAGMKNIIYFIAIAVLFSACKKNGGSGGTGTPGNSDLMYPATLAFDNNTGYPEKSTFKYDDKHHMTYFGNGARFTNVGSSSTALVVITGKDTLVASYLFDGDIYAGNNIGKVEMNYLNMYSSGNHLQGPNYTYYFTYSDASHTTLGSYNGSTYTQHFTYDDKGNVSFSNFITNAVGSPNSTNYDPGGLEYDRITFKGYDDKPSPYSAVPGYRFIAYPWAYPWQMYLALSKHNPTQIIEESLNTSTMKWSVYTQSDITYSYNDQGYPTEVIVKVSSPGTAYQPYYQKYYFTYTK